VVTSLGGVQRPTGTHDPTTRPAAIAADETRRVVPPPSHAKVSPLSASTAFRTFAPRTPHRAAPAFSPSASLAFAMAFAAAVVLLVTGAFGAEAASSEPVSAAPAGQTAEAPTTSLTPVEAAPEGAVQNPAPGEAPAQPAPPADDQPTEAATAEAAPPQIETAEAPQAPDRTGFFASVGSLGLHLPAHDVIVTGFHQASTPGSLAMTPQAGHRVLPSRGRGSPATSAVDIVLPDDQPVRSPVSGTVTHVESYSLYGRYPDRRIIIRPHDAPQARVVMLHVTGVRVEAGHEVEGGVTEIAGGARRFPFRSQVDAETKPHSWPNVHYEVKVRS
jgi:murein DD-endopeptidase MepM/ murein hydrolase activator NlpD